MNAYLRALNSHYTKSFVDMSSDVTDAGVGLLDGLQLGTIIAFMATLWVSFCVMQANRSPALAIPDLTPPLRVVGLSPHDPPV